MQHVPGSGEEMIRVLVADDTRIHTQLLADALRRDSVLEIISSPSHSRDLVEAARVQKVDAVVISANLDEDRYALGFIEARIHSSGFPRWRERNFQPPRICRESFEMYSQCS